MLEEQGLESCLMLPLELEVGRTPIVVAIKVDDKVPDWATICSLQIRYSRELWIMIRRGFLFIIEEEDALELEDLDLRAEILISRLREAGYRGDLPVVKFPSIEKVEKYVGFILH